MNPMKPTTVDFWADVCRAIKSACPRDVSFKKFHMAYTLYDSTEVIDVEKHAHKILGDRRHSVEQRVGAEFVRRKIWPVQGKGYFHAIRGKGLVTRISIDVVRHPILNESVECLCIDPADLRKK